MKICCILHGHRRLGLAYRFLLEQLFAEADLILHNAYFSTQSDGLCESILRAVARMRYGVDIIEKDVIILCLILDFVHLLDQSSHIFSQVKSGNLE